MFENYDENVIKFYTTIICN